ncbi:nuclear transport factor 2 family protein [Stenotrophomonas pavanii]
MLLLTLPLLAAGLVAAPAPADTLRAQIRQADTQLFAAAFEACDADKAAAMTTEDMEFFHDKDGKSASNREDFRRSVASLCDSTRKGGWRLRRERVEPSLQVFPLHDERALEIGDHRFYERGKGRGGTLGRPGPFHPGLAPRGRALAGRTGDQL